MVMHGLLPVLLVVVSVGAAQAATAATDPARVAGRWSGDLTLRNGQSLPLVLHLDGKPSQWRATLDSPAQSAFGLPVDTVAISGNALHLELKRLHARYDATIAPSGTMSGMWHQGAGALPLAMHHEMPEETAPQAPTPPFPYRSVDVTFDNPVGPAHLAGTLTLPEGEGPFAAVLLITGSGTQDRDETIMGHKPFLIWADALTRRGIAVLRVDDRQAGASTGPVAKATTADFATDVESGLAFLHHRADVDPARIGLMGHSEGALIADMVAAKDPQVAFVVMLAGTGVPGRRILLRQIEQIGAANGMSPAVVHQNVVLETDLLNAVRGATTQEDAEHRLETVWHDQHAAAGQMPAALRRLSTAWMRWFVAHDPAGDLARVRCPVLAIGGSRDLQVDPQVNLPAIRNALHADSDVTVQEIPGLNHLFQKAETGSPREYRAIRETVDPAVLTLVGDWIVRHMSPATRY